MDPSNLVFVDCEARGRSPVNGTMTEFGCVHYSTRDIFHGVLFESTPDPEKPVVPVVGRRVASDLAVATALTPWLRSHAGDRHPVFVSDNPAWDWQWIAGMFDRADLDNPFGHSARRLGDFWAGLHSDWTQTQSWKSLRKTKHTHNPVDDAMGNVEAFAEMLELANLRGELHEWS